MRIHDRQQQRYRCRSCGHTFSARRGTMLEGLREPTRDRKLADRLLHLHHELSKVTHQDFACTPAMASGLTDHIWSVEEVLTYKVAPAPWV